MLYPVASSEEETLSQHLLILILPSSLLNDHCPLLSSVLSSEKSSSAKAHDQSKYVPRFLSSVYFMFCFIVL